MEVNVECNELNFSFIFHPQKDKNKIKCHLNILLLNIDAIFFLSILVFRFDSFESSQFSRN